MPNTLFFGFVSSRHLAEMKFQKAHQRFLHFWCESLDLQKEREKLDRRIAKNQEELSQAEKEDAESRSELERTPTRKQELAGINV